MKTFVLDTSVLLLDAQCILKFGKNYVHIPLACIEELDRFKRDQNENGRNARQFSRIVDRLRSHGSLAEGIKLESGGTLIISPDSHYKERAKGILDLDKNDNLILAKALFLKDKGEKVVLISKDINLRLKGDALGIKSEDYETQDITLDELFTGHRLLTLEENKFKDFEKDRFLELSKKETESIMPNEYLIMNGENNPGLRLLGRYCEQKGGVVPLIRMREGVWGIHPKNIEQQFAFDALLNNEVKLVTLVGKAGTGKTLMAIAAGLEMAIGQQHYSRVLVSRPIWPMGKDLGYLPGDINEKLGPWMQPIFDNIDYLFGNQGNKKGTLTASWEDLINQGLLHVEPLTYIRGRSIPGQYLIVDEAQNLTPHEVKTIITRAGEGTKIVLTGDCEQIDNPYLDSVNNGLAFVVDRLKSEKIVAHTTLLHGERSELSEVATKLL